MKYTIIGFLSGIISGMGIGGGTIFIPALLFFSDLTQKQAQITNLMCFVPTAIAALFVHIKNKEVEVKILKPLLIFGIIGAAAGAVIAMHIDNEMLKKSFGVFLFLMAIREFRAK